MVDFRNDADMRLDLVAKVTQKFFRHEGHVDRKHQQMRAVRLRQRSSKAAERPARWRLVCDELNIGRTPHWISLSQTSRHRAGRSAALLLRSEEHTSELQSLRHLVCRLLL